MVEYIKPWARMRSPVVAEMVPVLMHGPTRLTLPAPFRRLSEVKEVAEMLEEAARELCQAPVSVRLVVVSGAAVRTSDPLLLSVAPLGDIVTGELKVHAPELVTAPARVRVEEADVRMEPESVSS